MKIHNAFKQIRKEKHFKQSEFDGVIGRCGVSRFESGEADLSSSKLIACLERMGATFGDVFAATQNNDPQRKTYIPIYSWSDLRFKRRQASQHITYPKGASIHAYGLNVQDDSMISNVSAYPVGTTLIVEPTAQAKDGDLIIVMKRKMYYFRRYVSGLAIPDNEAHDIIEEPNIIGRVVGVTWTV